MRIPSRSHASAGKAGIWSGTLALVFSLCFCLNASLAWATEPPVSTSPPTIEGEATVDSPLKGGKGAWEGTTPLSYQWQWLRCDVEGGECEPIEGAIEPNRPVRELDLGSTLRLKVTATNKAGSASETSSATAVITEPEPPANTSSPSLEGDMHVGETVSANVGTWSHHPSAFEFQWQLCDAEGESCENLEGETDQTLLLPGESEGSRVRAAIKALNRGGENTVQTTVSGLVGSMIAPANEIRPTPDFPEETRPLEVEVGQWSGGRPMSFAYQWFHCNKAGEECAELAGATKASYTPSSEDVDGRLKVKVTATNAAGSARETSQASFFVSKSAPWFSGDVEIQGEPTEEGELSADISELHGSKPMEVKYQWLRCFEGCEPIPSATAATYVPNAEDVAHHLRVHVTAHNSSSEYASRTTSPYSSPVEPAETEGPPRLAAFPEVEGLPSTGEVLTATDGVWRGAGEISTTVRWQRCAGGAETCEDIEGATEASYELGPEDTGNRIRAVVTASSEEGEAEDGSTLTAPILPAENTVWTLEGELSVKEVLEAAQESDAPIVGIEYADKASFGAYSGGIAGTEAKEVLEAIEETADPDVLIVKRLTVSGDFTESGEGGEEEFRRSWDPIRSLIEGLTKHERKTPSVRPPKDVEPEPEPGPPPFYQPDRLPDPGDQEPKEPTIGDPGLRLPIVTEAEVFAMGWECLGSECDEPGASETSWTPTPRMVEYDFKWGIGLEDMLTEIYEQGTPLALEFDVKLINPQNSDSQWNCPDSEENDFWISDRDDKSYELFIPEDAGPYWDTSALDPCSRKDLTIGVYHPEELEKGEEYGLTLNFNKAGDSPTSGIEWHAELLERAPNCDDTPWCVNVEPEYDDYRLPQVIIPYGYGWPFPYCYKYKYDPGKRGADECVYPV